MLAQLESKILDLQSQIQATTAQNLATFLRPSDYPKIHAKLARESKKKSKKIELTPDSFGFIPTR